MADDTQDLLRLATEHHTDLNIFAAIMALCEGGLIYSIRGQKAAAQIVQLCRVEQQMQLRAYDRAVARAHSTKESDNG